LGERRKGIRRKELRAGEREDLVTHVPFRKKNDKRVLETTRSLKLGYISKRRGRMSLCIYFPSDTKRKNIRLKEARKEGQSANSEFQSRKSLKKR